MEFSPFSTSPMSLKHMIIWEKYFKSGLFFISLVWMEMFIELNMWGKSNKVAKNPHIKSLASVLGSTFYFALSYAVTHPDRKTHTFYLPLSSHTQTLMLKLHRLRCWLCTDVLGIPVVSDCAFCACQSNSETERESFSLSFTGYLEMSSALHSCSETQNTHHICHMPLHLFLHVVICFSALFHVTFIPTFPSCHVPPLFSFFVTKPYQKWVRLLRLVT